jgi:uncharacterized membrane protein HdeD (DUF308 family)
MMRGKAIVFPRISFWEPAMVTVADFKKQWAWITGLRGLLMVIAGIYAVIWPAQALTIIVIAGGVLLLIDGVLGLWSLTFGGAKTGNYWFDVVRNVLAIITGVLVLISPMIATLVAVTFIIYFVAIQAIIVGVMEIVIVVRERESYARIWPVVLSGAINVVFGIALLFAPLLGATILVIFGGVLAIFFGVALIGLAWQLSKAAGAKTA